MKVIAKTIIGHEYMYNARTARKVSARSAAVILEAVNQHKYLLNTADNEIWHIYDVDEFDNAYYYAQRQSFTIRNGIVTARAY